MWASQTVNYLWSSLVQPVPHLPTTLDIISLVKGNANIFIPVRTISDVFFHRQVVYNMEWTWKMRFDLWNPLLHNRTAPLTTHRWCVQTPYIIIALCHKVIPYHHKTDIIVLTIQGRITSAQFGLASMRLPTSLSFIVIYSHLTSTSIMQISRRINGILNWHALGENGWIKANLGPASVVSYADHKGNCHKVISDRFLT